MIDYLQTNSMALLVSAGIGLIMSAMIGRWILDRARSKMSDISRVDAHHGHTADIPRTGGAALAGGLLAVVASALILLPEQFKLNHETIVILLSSVAMFGLGFWDDLKPLGARRKFVGQIIIALAVYALGLGVEKFKVPFTSRVLELGMLGGAAFTVFWLVAMTNLINLIDGIDGLAGGISLMLMLLLTYVSHAAGGVTVMCAGMAGALIGFLRYNFPPAKIYMGDGGAYMLGFLVGITTIASSQKGTVLAALAAPLFVLALPIIDTALAIMRRGLRGLPVFRPDRRHLHHHMMQSKGSHRRAVIAIYSFCLVFLFLGFVTFWTRGQALPILLGIAVLIILIVAGTLNFSREWFFVGRVIGNSLQMRAEVQYALAHVRWFELESRRRNSIMELWEDFVFIARKLGYIGVSLRLAGAEHLWADGTCPNPKNHHIVLHRGMGELTLKSCLCALSKERADVCGCGNCSASPSRSPVAGGKAHEIMAEVLAEAWFKTSRDWMNCHARSETGQNFAEK